MVMTVSVFLNEDFKDGILLDKSNEKFRIKGRYNAEIDEMQILVDGEVRSVLYGKVNAIALETQIFIPKVFVDKDDVIKNFSPGILYPGLRVGVQIWCLLGHLEAAHAYAG